MTLNYNDFQETVKIHPDNVWKHKELGYSVLKSPTANCQVFSMKALDLLLYNKDFKAIENHFKNAARLTGKRQALIDVYSQFEKVLEKVFEPGQFIIKQRYINGTGSSMIVCMIKIKL